MPTLWKVLCIVSDTEVYAGAATSEEQADGMRSKLAAEHPGSQVMVFPRLVCRLPAHG